MTSISSDTRQRDTRVDVIGAGTFLTSLDHLIIWSTSKAPASLGLHSFWVWGLPWDGHEMVRTQVEFKHWFGSWSAVPDHRSADMSYDSVYFSSWLVDDRNSTLQLYVLSRLHNISWPLLHDWEASCNQRSSGQVNHMCELRSSCDNFQTVREST